MQGIGKSEFCSFLQANHVTIFFELRRMKPAATLSTSIRFLSWNHWRQLPKKTPSTSIKIYISMYTQTIFHD